MYWPFTLNITQLTTKEIPWIKVIRFFKVSIGSVLTSPTIHPNGTFQA
jgi:hypothetical protein